MMSAPVPAPRICHQQQGVASGEAKKPIPTPRKTITREKSNESSSTSSKSSEEHTNTFSRRVRLLSHASKQIAEDLGGLVNDKKKAMIEGTRQSVRRMTRRFNTNPLDQSPTLPTENNNIHKSDIDDSIDIFNSISFQSPISSASQSIYNNLDETSSTSSSLNHDEDEYISSPPPNHPPPPLPDDSFYDAPQSLSASSSSTTTATTSTNESTGTGTGNNQKQIQLPENYESVYPPFMYNSDSESCVDLTTAETLDRTGDLRRSESWMFYDTVEKSLNNENIYNDIDNSSNNEENNSNLDNNSTIDVRNSIYENYEIKNYAVRNRPSESVIYQFDPLKKNATSEEQQQSSEINKILEELLHGDFFGSLSRANTLDSWSISNDSESEDFIPPPPPPVRTDSLPEDEQQPQQQQQQQQSSQPVTPLREKSRTSWFAFSDQNNTTTSSTSSSSSTNNNNNNKPVESKRSGWLKQVKEVLEKTTKHKDVEMVQRPALNLKNFIHKIGMLYKVQGGPVEDLFGEYSGRWCILQNSSFICYSDSNCETIREHFPTETILSIQILQDPKFKYRYDNEDLHCFELNTTGKTRGGHIYGSRDVAERRIWMQSIAESMTNKFSTKLTTDYTRMGWAYVREGVSGKWMGAWLLLSKRTLYYAFDDQPVKQMDLRKVRCIVLQIYQDSDNNPKTNDKGPNMVVDSPHITLYIRMWTSRETKVWCHIVKLAAHNNGANLDQQQLTKNNIPVIVEKCINFIYANGSMTEGIYRRPGVGSSVSDLLMKFRKDAWAVQLTHDKYSEHDVATALKRFFRDLPDSLLSNNQRQYFYEVSRVKNKDEQIRMYKAALDHLPPISYNTAKKLLGHLHFISTQCNKNLMNVENLAAIWGPTLMHYDNNVTKSTNNAHERDSSVVKQLIQMYRYIFPEDPSEIEQEKLMLQVLERYTKSPQGAIGNKKKAGDFRLWIYFDNKEGRTFNVAIGPNKTAYEIAVELSSKIDIPVDKLIIEEVILNDKLVRPLHYSEKVLDVVLRWGYWDEPDRKDNHLIITKLTKYFDFIQTQHLPVVSGELKFADNKNKNCKTFMFEFSQAKLSYFKDRTCEVKLNTWNVEDIIWYLGHEDKRNPQSRWTITFIETKTHPKRKKSTPYFGNVIAWNDPTTRASWLAAMLKARYADSLIPPAMHVNLLSS